VIGPHFQLGRRQPKGAALVIILAFVVLLTGLVVAYLSRTTGDRQLAKASFDDTASDLLARNALVIITNDFKQERASAAATPSATDIQPQRYGVPSAADTPIPNLIRRSVQGDPTGRTSTLSSSTVSANGRSVSVKRWNTHYLIPRAPAATDSDPVSSFIAPNWVLVTSQGPNSAPAPSDVIGRYAYAVYDEGGLLDMNLAGSPVWATSGGGGGPNPSPTPWMVNVGRKGILTFADLTAIPAAATTFFPQAQINKIIGWRNYATTKQTGVSFDAPSYPNNRNTQDSYGSYLLDFGDPPFTDPSVYPFTFVSAQTSDSRSDQAFITRQHLLKLRDKMGFSLNLLQYLGTFSREINAPAPSWPLLKGHLSNGRFSITNLDLVKPNPAGGTSPGRGKGATKNKGRGHLKGMQGDIVNLFGLRWVPSSVDPVTNKWKPGYWRYIEHTGGTPTNTTALGHIPPFKGGGQKNDFFQILDYALFRVDFDTTGEYDLDHLAKTFAIGASLIDQYDSDEDDLDTLAAAVPTGTPVPVDPAAQTHTTVIEYSPGTFAYGMETSDLPYDAGPTPPPAPHRPQAAPAPIAGTTVVINHAFTNVGELGYGIDTSAAALPTLNFYQNGSSDAPVLDFFSYNPVSSAYPRAGIVNLNTRNAPVLAALLKGANPTETAAQAAPAPTPVVPQAEAMTAAQAIVAATSAANGAALNRGDIARLASVAGSAIGVSAPGSLEEKKETIARALAEVTQTRTWNLMIDVIAQTGRYAPGASNINGSFNVQGEKRYWLHIAIDRYTGQILGQELESVIE